MATSAKTTKSTKTGRTTARKSTAAGKSRSAGTKAAPKTKLTGVTEAPNAADAPTAAEAPKAAEAKAPPAPIFKMPDLMQALEGKSELKRAELRQTVGHVLEALGAALAGGKDVALPGFGKITAKRRETKPGGEQIVARIKLNTPDSAPAELPGPDET